ncbi:MAG: hypothetical protein MUC31_01325, partial [Bacteroidales bacterium]|nr:hypothetical protein [Bacteroidales bacterium]
INSYWESIKFYNPNDIVKIYDPMTGAFAGTVYQGEVWAPGTFGWQALIDPNTGSYTQFAAGVKQLSQMGLTVETAPTGTQFLDLTDLTHPYKTIFTDTKDTLTTADDENYIYKPTGIDLYELERAVLINPYISSCEVFQTIDGGLVLKARVREPLVRIITEENQQFYLDYSGCAMPLKPGSPSHVLIANGRIRDRYISIDKSEKPLTTFSDSSLLHQVYPVAYFISADEFLRSFIDQIYVNENSEIELVPKIGSQAIIFGNASDTREKLENLKTFYQKVMSNMDWNIYKSINLKYKNQVVCSKYVQYEQK